MPLASYFIEGRFAGQSRLRSPFAHSLTYVCLGCGKQWANIVVEGAPWFVNAAPCRQHRRQGMSDWGFECPGSLFDYRTTAEDLPVTVEALYPDNLPMPVVKWELERHLDELEKGIGC